MCLIRHISGNVSWPVKKCAENVKKVCPFLGTISSADELHPFVLKKYNWREIKVVKKSEFSPRL